MPMRRASRNPGKRRSDSDGQNRVAELAQLLESVPGATRHGNSRWAEGPTFRVGSTEIAHFHRDGSFDVRLTSEVIRRWKTDRSLDPRVVTRRPSAQWVKLPIRGGLDFALALALLEEAVRANQ